MYKHNKNSRLEQSKSIPLWLKRKFMLLITAFMIGMSNGMNAEEKTINGNYIRTEQQDKKD